MSATNNAPRRPVWPAVLLAALNRLWPAALVSAAACLVGLMFFETAPQQGGFPQQVTTILCCVVAVGGTARHQWRLFRADLARLGVWPRE